jgi:uncharacterized protein
VGFKFAEVKNDDGKMLRASVHQCSSKGGTWVIFCHGLTGHRLGPNYLYVRISRALEQKDISSLRFDFSGSGESDGTFQEMTVATMLSDLLSIVKHVRRTYSPSRMVLLGHSLGGLVAATACAEVKPDALVLLAPVADPLGMTRRRKEIVSGGPNKRGYFENGPHEMSIAFLMALKGAKPLDDISAHFRGKLLLMQGDADPSVEPVESRRYVQAAREAGLTVTSRVLKGIDHNFSRVSAVNTLCSVIPAWIKEQVS